jgi:anion-transporting  ArsA/GET3 family ATPase
MTELLEVLSKRSVVVCCGSGGVGKTTTAAALGMLAAGSGRRVCVVTIDPARRLADALGAKGLENEARPIPGPFEDRLFALMLDARRTFDDLVLRYSRDAVQSQRILSNRLYQNLASVLSGTQEYMATEKLFELHESGRFDLVVVDTPPTRHALDFLDAPRRLAGFLDNRLFRVLVTPGRAYLKAMGVATRLLLRTLGRVAGSEIVDDTVAFFQAFEGMEQGFRERASAVERLLAEEATGFVMVAAARRDSIEETAYLSAKLAGAGHGLDALVVNRVHPDFGPAIADERARPAAPGGGGPGPGAWQALTTNLAETAALVARESAYLDALAPLAGDAPIVRVPILDDDVHDLAGLELVARHLSGRELPWGHGPGGGRR